MNETPPAVEDIADIVPPEPVDNPLVTALWAVALGVVAATFLAWLIAFLVRRARQADPPLPGPSPRDWALAEFDKLRPEAANLEPREAGLRLTAILKEYLSREERLPRAEFRTSEEIFRAQQAERLKPFEDLFARCDALNTPLPPPPKAKPPI
ncbi:MAG: DUF4381 family protein [Verrucomicrobiales bacterium]